MATQTTVVDVVDVTDARDRVKEFLKQLEEQWDKARAVMVEKVIKDLPSARLETSPQIAWRKQFDDAAKTYEDRRQALEIVDSYLERHAKDQRTRPGSASADALIERIKRLTTMRDRMKPPRSAGQDASSKDKTTIVKGKKKIVGNKK
jgi:hypothetical protein